MGNEKGKRAEHLGENRMDNNMLYEPADIMIYIYGKGVVAKEKAHPKTCGGRMRAQRDHPGGKEGAGGGLDWRRSRKSLYYGRSSGRIHERVPG